MYDSNVLNAASCGVAEKHRAWCVDLEFASRRPEVADEDAGMVRCENLGVHTQVAFLRTHICMYANTQTCMYVYCARVYVRVPMQDASALRLPRTPPPYKGKAGCITPKKIMTTRKFVANQIPSFRIKATSASRALVPDRSSNMNAPQVKETKRQEAKPLTASIAQIVPSPRALCLCAPFRPVPVCYKRVFPWRTCRACLGTLPGPTRRNGITSTRPRTSSIWRCNSRNHTSSSPASSTWGGVCVCLRRGGGWS